MIKKYWLLLMVLHCLSYAQTWQWAKRGGAMDELNQNNINRQEEVYSIVTDSQKNIYILSAVGISNLNIDGNPKVNYGDYITKTDYALSSFSCDGSYRWSKIIGGGGIENVHELQIDTEDNLYVAGKFGNCQSNEYLSRIDNDIILSQDPTDCSLIFITKFNSQGVMLWFKRPQPTDVSLEVGYSQTTSRGLAIDPQGNTYWLVALPSGTYANGLFVNELPGTNWFILSYDKDGNYLNAKNLDLHLDGASNLYLKFYRNPYSGNFYITGLKDSADHATIGGQTVSNSAFIACFDTAGQFLWKRENTSATFGGLFIYNLLFDSENNMYVSGRLIGMNLDSFLGLNVPEPIATGFVLKVDQTAEHLLWKTYYNHNGADNYGAITLKNNEIGYAGYCFGANFTWGSQSIFAGNQNEGTDVLLARFNKETGECIALVKIPGDVGYNDNGTSIAVDASGDYILGGRFEHNLYVNGATLNNNGLQSDFFIAKYATSACSPLTNPAFSDGALQMYPNPAQDRVYINTNETLEYTITSITGAVLDKGIIKPEANTIDVSLLTSGYYMIDFRNSQGKTKVLKLFLK